MAENDACYGCYTNNPAQWYVPPYNPYQSYPYFPYDSITIGPPNSDFNYTEYLEKLKILSGYAGLSAAPDCPKLTNDEKDVLAHLTNAFEKFIKLPDMEYLHKDFCDAIHRAQSLVALRLAKRVEPEVFRD